MSATNTQLIKLVKNLSYTIINRLDAINTNLMLIEQQNRENVYDASQIAEKSPDIVINNLPSEPDWSKAPEWANWFQICKSGNGFWNEDEPVFNESFGEWFLQGSEHFQHAGVFDGQDYQNSLRQRPKTECVNITASLNADTDGYLAGKKSFISAYVDLLLARMAKEDRYSDDDCVGEFPAPDALDVCIYSRDGENEQFAIILGKETSGYSTRLFTWVLGSGNNSFGFFNLDDTDFSSESESWLRTITELEAVIFRKAMEVVYG